LSGKQIRLEKKSWQTRFLKSPLHRIRIEDVLYFQIKTIYHLNIEAREELKSAPQILNPNSFITIELGCRVHNQKSKNGGKKI